MSTDLLKYCLIALALSFFSFQGNLYANEAVPVAEDLELEKRLNKLAENLRCLVCQNETLAASRADFSVDMRNEIREQMKMNKSDEEIIDFLVARYGDFILFNPPFKPTTWLLWLGPFTLLLVGGFALFFYLKHRGRTKEAELTLTDKERLRAESLIKEMDKD